MLEIDDYNGEYFFEKEEEWNEYQSIIDDGEEPSPQEKDSAYVIFTLEQAISTINEVINKNKKVKVAAYRAVEAINDFIKQYTRLNEEN